MSKQTGLNTRQYYKAMAVVGLLSNPAYIGGAVSKSAEQFAEDAAKIADAMIAEDESH